MSWVDAYRKERSEFCQRMKEHKKRAKQRTRLMQTDARCALCGHELNDKPTSPYRASLANDRLACPPCSQILVRIDAYYDGSLIFTSESD